MYEVNRSSIVLIPQQPFWQWLKSLPEMQLGSLTLEDLQQDANCYLIAPCDSIDEAWEAVYEELETIFAAELADWCEDESEWPDLHPDIFAEWFELRLAAIVTDISRHDLEREPFTPLSLNSHD